MLGSHATRVHDMAADDGQIFSWTPNDMIDLDRNHLSRTREEVDLWPGW